ncbi:MAG TPA: sigma-70 family RNA polymerase sigma factor [Solirubrobacteraceae bacterium]|jgi:RNA polymerase sigma-70 factor (ECF subfamily)
MTESHTAPVSADRERLEHLFRAHEPAIVAYLRRRAAADTVDDLVAETFLVAWRRLDDVPLQEPLPWLLAVARRVLSTHRRGRDRRRNLGERMMDVQPRSRSWEEDGEDRATAALARLSERDREALTLIAWEGLTPQQAATVLGEPPGRFRVRLHRAKRRMKALLSEPPSSAPAAPRFSTRQGASR